MTRPGFSVWAGETGTGGRFFVTECASALTGFAAGSSLPRVSKS